METISIHTDWIQLDQALKKEGIIGTGGEMAFFLESHVVLLNGKQVTEKRKKLFPGDCLSVQKKKYQIVREIEKSE